jgi:hypothetical protein
MHRNDRRVVSPESFAVSAPAFIGRLTEVSHDNGRPATVIRLGHVAA